MEIIHVLADLHDSSPEELEQVRREKAEKRGGFLENGGGKSTTIQLLLQTVLPNCSLAERYLIETLDKGTTGVMSVRSSKRWKKIGTLDLRTGKSFNRTIKLQPRVIKIICETMSSSVWMKSG